MKKKIESERKKSNPLDGSNVDFDNPTPEMIEEAKTRGIDLTDPRVVSMLKTLKAQKEAGSTTDPNVAAQAYHSETRQKLLEMVADMKPAEIKSALLEMDVNIPEGSTNSDYKDFFVDALMEGKKLPEGFQGPPPSPVRMFIFKCLKWLSGGNTSFLGNFRNAFFIMCIILAYRAVTRGGREGGWKMKVPVVEEVKRQGGISVGEWENEEF